MANTNAKKKPLSIQIPRLDSFDVFSLLLWFGVLIPAVQLPSSATYTFARSLFLVVWVALFAVYVAYRIFAEKRMVFYSATTANTLIAALGGVFVLSYILSASPIDSLFGYDLSFSSSFLVLFSVVVMYFVLKLAGLSLELAVSRILSVLPVALVVIDFLSLASYLLPTSVYDKLLGSYSQYFTFLTASPAGLLGGAQQATIIHIIALVIAAWQFSMVYKKGAELTVEIYRRGIVGLFLAITTSYVFFLTFTPILLTIVVFVVVAAIIASLVMTQKSSQIKMFGTVLAIVMAFATLLGGIWWKAGIIGDAKSIAISAESSNSIIQQSFLNSSTPMWRQLVGFGVGTFPYLYMQYRPIASAQQYGNDTFFFKPNTFVSELFLEHGALGVLVFAALVVTLIMAFKNASSKSSLLPEVSVILISIGALLVGPSSLAVLVILFVAIAAFFDKVEALPELLPSVRAVDIKESTYTNKSSSMAGNILFGAAVLYAVVMFTTLVTPSMTMVGYAKAIQRYAVARQQVTKKDTAALQTYSDAYSLSSAYRRYCKDCAQLSYLSLSTLLGTSDLYNGLTEEQRNTSQELRQVRNMMLQSVTDLLSKNSVRYDYWLTVSQAYRGIADDEKSTSLYTLAVQSVRNALAVNQYSIDANYLYVDVLLRLGNDAQINNEIKSKLAILKQLVGTPFQIQFIDGIMLAREQNYDGAIKAFEAIKKEAADSQSMTTDEKKQITSLADKRIEEVNKLKQSSTQTKPPAATKTVTPTVTVTPTPTQAQ